MKLHIVNAAKQRQVFAYRKTETDRLIQVPTSHGDQIMVPGGTTEEVDAVVQHHQVYGLANLAKIDQGQVFIGLCYSLGKPALASVIEKAIYDNDTHLTRRVHGRRQVSVATLDSSLHDSGTGYPGETEASAEQAEGREDNEDTSTVNETVVTEKTGSKKK